MTLCVAALCEQGNPQGAKVVCAVDGRLSHIVSADVNAPKMLFLGDFVFMFAGTLGNADLMMDEIRPIKFTPQQIKELVRDAYRKRMAQWSVDRFLLQYQMDMQEFKTEGRKIFGDERFAELSRSMEQDAAANYREEVLVVGWHGSKNKPVFFGMNRDGLTSHALDSLAAIGSGAEIAMSTMLGLGQNRGMILEETLYSVVSAKFAAESCEGVGKETTVFISWKRTDKDDATRLNGNFINELRIGELRQVWEKYGKPRVPQQGWNLFTSIATELFEGKGRQLTLEHIEKHSEAMRRTKSRPSISQKSEPKP